MLKLRIKSLEDVEEKVRSLYKKDGDGYVLDAEAPEESKEVKELRDKVKEFRESNINLTREREALNTALEKYKDVDPVKYKEAVNALDMINALEEKDLIKEGKFDQVIERRVQNIRRDFEDKMRDTQKRTEVLEKEALKYKDSYRGLKVETEVNRVFPDIASIRPGAAMDVMRRAKEVWQVNDKDELVAKELYGDDGKPMTFQDWGKRLVKDAGHLFDPGSGGGAGGGSKKSGKADGKDGKKIVDGNNPVEVGRYMKEIASGEVLVSSTGGTGDGD